MLAKCTLGALALAGALAPAASGQLSPAETGNVHVSDDANGFLYVTSLTGTDQVFEFAPDETFLRSFSAP